MINAIGSIIFGLSIAAAGFYAAAAVKKRIRFLECCIKLIKTVSLDIGYCGEPVLTIMKKASESKELDELSFLKELANCEENDFSESWSAAIDKFTDLSLFDKADADMLKCFGSKLGTTDSLHQTQLCDEYIKRFEERYEYENNRMSERIRLYRVGGTVCGLAALILLL